MSVQLMLTEPQELTTTESVSMVLLDLDNMPSDLSKEQVRDIIKELEELLKLMPQVDLPVKHFFSKAVYGRELRIPKGMLIVGKIHKFQVMNVLSAGEVSVYSIDGVVRIKAPYTFVSSPGAKRVIYAHEDSIWSTFHGTEETDIAKIEEQFIAKDYSQVVDMDLEIVGRPELELKES